MKVKVILMVFVAFCHTLDNGHVNGNFILFAMNIKVMVISWGKTSQYYYYWTPTFAVLAKNINFFSIFSQVQSRSDDVCFGINLTMIM